MKDDKAQPQCRDSVQQTATGRLLHCVGWQRTHSSTTNRYDLATACIFRVRGFLGCRSSRGLLSCWGRDIPNLRPLSRTRVASFLWDPPGRRRTALSVVWPKNRIFASGSSWADLPLPQAAEASDLIVNRSERSFERRPLSSDSITRSMPSRSSWRPRLRLSRVIGAGDQLAQLRQETNPRPYAHHRGALFKSRNNSDAVGIGELFGPNAVPRLRHRCENSPGPS